MDLENKLMTSIIPSDLTQFKEKIAKCNTKFIEHRIDGLINPDMTEFQYNDYEFEFLVTNRPKSDSKKTEESEKERIDILKKAITNGAKFVDIEFETSKNLRQDILRFAQRNNVTSIISYHNYEKTPSLEDLTKIAMRMKSTGADIIKCVCMTHSYADAHVMIELQHNWSTNILAFGMGSYGSFSRIISILYGAPFMYVPLDKKTAPGQLHIEEVKAILRYLNQS